MTTANPFIGIPNALAGARSHAAGWRSVCTAALGGGGSTGLLGARRVLRRRPSKGGLPT